MHFPTLFTLVAGLAMTAQAADNWCVVSTADGNVNCRSGPGTSYKVVRTIKGSDHFGVNCLKKGTSVGGNANWDWIPGWGCYVSAYYTRAAAKNYAGSGQDLKTCEQGVSRCP